MNTEQKTYTHAQLTIVQDLCETHGLQPDQISFEGTELKPIFDFEAVSLLSLRLAELPDIDCWVSGRDLATGTSTAKCRIVLPDGQRRTVEDSASIGEVLGNGVTLVTVRDADSQAQNRATRRGIRSVGVNLYNAHVEFKKTGAIATPHLRNDPRAPAYREIHVLATELDLIVDGDKTGYRHLMAEMFDGVESTVNLNDIQLHQFLVGLRAMAGAKRYKAASNNAA